MASPTRSSNDSRPEPDVTRLDVDALHPTDDHAKTFLDAWDEVAKSSDTLVPGPETPPEALPLTVDFQPATPALPSSTSDEPLLTITNVTEVGIGSKPGVPLGPAPSVRHSVPGYEILKELGRGGMGVVYQARQQDLNRLVALKMILSGDHAGSGERERFRREAESVAALQHTNIVQIYEIGETEGRPYLAFEYIEGGSLANHLGGNPWPSRAAAALVEILARAMQFAHDRGIVHRDLKPGNILLSVVSRPLSVAGMSGKDGKPDSNHSNDTPLQRRIHGQRTTDNGPIPKITDFGLAKRVETESDWSATGEIVSPAPAGQTRTGAVMGTPSYIAPEQAAGKNRDVGPLADVYSLGAILYELLTGRPPFRGETALDTVLQVMSDDPVPPRRLQPKVPRDLETICLKCLQKAPAKRYASAGELADDLLRFSNHETIAAHPTGSLERFIKWAKRHPAAATSLFISGFAVLTLLAISFYYNVELRQSADDKEAEAKRARDSDNSKAIALKDAQNQRKIADDRLKEVEEARKKADAATLASLKREEESRRLAYALALNQAAGLVERDPQRAARLLDNSTRCPFYLRDYTWYHLRSMCRVEEPSLAGHERAVTQIAYSPDGSLIATSSWDGTVRVWDGRTHQAVARLNGHQGLVRAVAFIDRRTLVSAGNDRRNQVRFWELPAVLPAGGGAVIILKSWAGVEAGDVHSLAVSPDRRRIVTGSGDGKLRVWKVPALPIAGLTAVGGGGASFASRRPEVGAGRERGPILPFSLKPMLEATLDGHQGEVTALVWGKEDLFSGSLDRTVRRWNVDDATSAVVFKHNDPVQAIGFDPGADLLAVAGRTTDDSSIHLWNLRQNRSAGQLRGHTRTVNSIAFSGDGKFLASASYDSTVRLWDAAARLERSVFRGHKELVLCVAFSPNQKTLASAGVDTTVRLWSLAGQSEETLTIDARAPFLSVVISTEARTLAIADKDGSIKIWRRGDATVPFAKLPTFALMGMNGRIAVLAISPAGETVAAAFEQGGQWMVGVWNVPAGIAGKQPIDVKLSRGWKAPAPIYALALHGRMLATAGESGLLVWNLDSRKLLFEPSTVKGKIHSLAFTPDGRMLVSAGGVYLQVWNVASGRELGALYFGHRNSDITTVAVGPPQSEDGKPAPPNTWTIVSTDTTGLGRIWDLEPSPPGMDGKKSPEERSYRFGERATMTGHAEPVAGISFAFDDKTIATASDDRTIRLWDPLTGQERAALTSHTDGVLLAAFLTDGSALLSAGREGAIKVWHAPR